MNAPTPRKWDDEITTARHDARWLAFESAIHQNTALRARVARALDRYGLGTSDIAIEQGLDYLAHKELGAAARYFNRTGKSQFNQHQLAHAISSFMLGKEQQRHMTDASIHDDADHDDEPTAGQIARHLADASLLAPDEYAARRDAARAIRAMVPRDHLDLYDLWLALREKAPPHTAPRSARCR